MAARTPMGIAHPTIVPTNFEREEHDPDEREEVAGDR